MTNIASSDTLFAGGRQGIRTPSEKSKNIGFLSYTCLDPLKIHKATRPAFNVSSSSACQQNALTWCFAGGPMIARLKWYFIWILRVSHHQLKKSNLDPSEKMFRTRAWFGLRSGSMFCWSRSGSKLFDTLILFLNEHFEKNVFLRKSADDNKSMEIYPTCKY